MDHPTLERLDAWRRGDVSEDEVLAIAEHLATCARCTTGASPLLGVDAAADALCDELEREDAPPKRVWPWLLAAAIAIAIIVPAIRNRTAPPPVVVTADRWTALEQRVRSGAPVDQPESLRAIRSESDVLRGAARSTPALEPGGVIVKTARPSFHWPAPAGATSEVQLFRGDSEVARSGALTGREWTPPHDLERGVTYTWTVRVEHGGTVEILPSSPSPVARFRVLEAGTLRELESAARRHPDDHLLLGILNARAGLTADATAELRRVDDPRDAAVARRVLRDIETWSR